MARIVAVAEVLWWWGACIGVWLVTLSSVSSPDLVAAVACSLPCAFAARAGRMAIGGRWRPRPAWWVGLALLAPSIVVDAARAFGTAARRIGRSPVADRFHTLELPRDEPETAAAARRAMAGLVLSATPATYVVDDDPDGHRLVIHRLTSGAGPLEKAVTR